MKRVIIFGLGERGKKIIEAYWKYDKKFEIIAIVDNNKKKQCCFNGIPVINVNSIAKQVYDEIWICTVYYEEIYEQLVHDVGVQAFKIKYVEYPMPLLESRIYDKYNNELVNNSKCKSPELQEVIDYIIEHGAKMYCYPFYNIVYFFFTFIN